MNHMAFENWLLKKSNDILDQAQNGPIKDTDMLLLCVSDINQQVVKIEVKIDRVEKSLSEKIGQVEFSLHEKIDRVEKSLNEKIDKVEKSLNEKIDKVEKSLNERMDKMEKSLNQRIDRIFDTFKWQTGLMIVMFGGIYLKLFIG